MRMVFGIALVIVLGLVGCGMQPEPVVTPSAIAEPVFASEEEAVAAAEAVYSKYTKASNLAAASGGRDLAVFEGLVTERLMEEEAAYAATLIERGWYLQGESNYRDFRLQQLTQSPTEFFLQAYACLDIRSVAYVDSEGVSQSSENPEEFVPMEIVIVNDPNQRDRLLVERADRWTGGNFC